LGILTHLPPSFFSALLLSFSLFFRFAWIYLFFWAAPPPFPSWPSFFFLATSISELFVPCVSSSLGLAKSFFFPFPMSWRRFPHRMFSLLFVSEQSIFPPPPLFLFERAPFTQVAMSYLFSRPSIFFFSFPFLPLFFPGKAAHTIFSPPFASSPLPR